MTGQVLTILFIQDKAFLAKDSPLNFEQLDLPPIAKSFKSPACWTIKVLNYDEVAKKIFAEMSVVKTMVRVTASENPEYTAI